MRLTRREWLAFVGLSALSCRASLAAATAEWAVRPVTGAAPLLQLNAAEGSALLGIDARGTLRSWAANGAGAQKIADGLDPATPIAIGHGRVAARTADGGLWVRDAGSASTTPTASLAINAGLLILPLAVIAIVVEGDSHRVARFESTGGRWSRTDLSKDVVMPDARPIQVPLDAKGDRDGHLVVLAGPDSTRYDHGILGDRIEATRVLWLERHELTVLRDMALPAPYVFEDIAPRPVAVADGIGLLTMRSGGAGTQLALVTVDPTNSHALRIAALGEPVGGPHRWLAPTTDGRRMLAVHTPHIGGVLNEYRRDGERLVRTVVVDDVANHHIGTRAIDLSVWIGSLLVVPDQAGRRLRVFDGAKGWAERAAIDLPARVTATTVLGDSRSFAVLMEGGMAAVVTKA